MNIAIIGCGAIAKNRHAPAVHAHQGAELYAVCDPVRESADALAAAYGTRARYALNDVLQDAAVDAVIICTPERFHCANVIAALQAQKDVLCEKPLAMNPHEGEAILQVWRTSGRKLMVAFSQRLYEEHRLAKKLLEEGAIGTPIAFRTALAHRGAEYAAMETPAPDFYDRRLSGIGNVMLSVGCHSVDLVAYLFGSAITAVSARTPTIDKAYADGTPISAADHAMITVELENGLPGTLWVSWCDYGAPERATLIYGTEGTMSVGGKPGVLVSRRDSSTRAYEIAQNPKEGQAITHHFINMLSGSEAAICDGWDGQACLLAMEAVKQSDREGRWVAVKKLGEGC